MLTKAGCPNTNALNADFLTTDPSDERFANVSHLLLDPSCSGSGIVNRLDYLMEPGELLVFLAAYGSDPTYRGRLRRQRGVGSSREIGILSAYHHPTRDEVYVGYNLTPLL